VELLSARASASVKMAAQLLSSGRLDCVDKIREVCHGDIAPDVEASTIDSLNETSTVSGVQFECVI
jgi:hypothetical protein